MSSNTAAIGSATRHRLGRLKVASEPYASRALLPLHLADLKRQREHSDVSIFLTPLSPGGGVISIFDLLHCSRRIGYALGFDSRIAYQSGHFPKRHHPQGGPEPLTSVDAVLECYRDADRLWFHVPEYQLTKHLPRYIERLSSLADRGVDVIVNVLNQNIQMMPEPDAFRSTLSQGSFRTTVTTAHHTYCRPELQEKYDVPWHHVSTWVTPEDYAFARYSNHREHRILLSPDHCEYRDEVSNMIRGTDPDLEISVISALTYEQYLELVFTSKWSLTFGEGLDGYFAEMGLSSGVPFAVYNEEFFTEDFLELDSVFATWDDLLDGWHPLFKRLSNDPALFEQAATATAEMLAKYYSRASHLDRLARYYVGDFDLP